MIHGDGSLHSLPCSHIKQSIHLAGQIPVELKRHSAAARAAEARRGQGRSAPHTRWRAGGGSRRAAGAGLEGNAAHLPAPSPARRKPRPGRALALAARARPSALRPRALAPSRRGRTRCACRALGTFVAGAAPGPERAPQPPQLRGPGRTRRRRLRPLETFPTPPALPGKRARYGVRGGRRGCGSGERGWSLAPAKNGKGTRAASGPREPAGCGAEEAGTARWEPGPLHRARRARPRRGEPRGCCGVPSARRGTESPLGRGLSGPKRAVGSRRRSRVRTPGRCC